jgi:CheY-like chemotaxis protein
MARQVLPDLILLDVMLPNWTDLRCAGAAPGDAGTDHHAHRAHR